MNNPLKMTLYGDEIHSVSEDDNRTDYLWEHMEDYILQSLHNILSIVYSLADTSLEEKGYLYYADAVLFQKGLTIEELLGDEVAPFIHDMIHRLKTLNHPFIKSNRYAEVENEFSAYFEKTSTSPLNNLNPN